MKVYKTRQGEIASQLPTSLDIKRILLARSPNPSAKDKKEVYRLEAGEAGEEKVIEIFQEYGPGHWMGLQNLWLKNYGTFEIDFTLITNHCQYVIEIKNYKGDYTYKDGVSTVDDYIIPKNPIDQTRQAVSNMQNILNEFGKNIPVKGVLIFTGKDAEVSIQSPVEDITILKVSQLKRFIQKIIHEEQAHAYPPINKQSIIDHIETHEVPHPYPPIPITREKMTQLRRGIYCALCGNFELEFQKYYVKCKCGFEEPKEEALVRSICEYGALNFERHLYTNEIIEFLSGQVSYSYLQKILGQHFEMVKNQRYTYYINKQLIYLKMFTQFKIKLPIIYQATRGRSIIHIFK